MAIAARWSREYCNGPMGGATRLARIDRDVGAQSAMTSLTVNERIQIVLSAGGSKSHRDVADEFNAQHPSGKRISHLVVANVLAMFRVTGSVCDRRTAEEMKVASILEEYKKEASKEDGEDEGDGYRYAVVDIKGRNGDEIHDLLMKNGYENFFLLNSLADHPDYEACKSQRSTNDSEHTSPKSADVSATASANSEQLVDIPCFGEVSATDLLGSPVDSSGHRPHHMGDCVEIDAEGRLTALVDYVASTSGKRYSSCSPDSIPVLMRESPTIVKLAKTAKCSELPLEELEIDPSIPPPDFSKRVYEFRSGYVTCQLCRNVISASRFSNLSNHARRHASIKKYKCVYCDVQLNELSKMRAHMFHAHEDDTSEAIDNTSSETQRVWDFLILKCFPLCGTPAAQEDIHNHITVRHLRREPNFENEEALFVLGPGVKQEEKTPSGGTITPSGMESRISKVNLPLEHLQKAVIGNYVEERMEDESTLACRLCNRMLDGKDLMGILMHAKAHYHIKQFECELCGHGSNTIGLVRRHIEVQHPLDSTDIIEHCDENMKKAWTQVIRVCFPSLPELLKSDRDNSSTARLAKEEVIELE
ncbi:hypothetical protein Q1695_008181 [Nippostrongylus brasiliensis]|nr:hypothetical protein Q1695_008181 [Nippostrongylus brasiliensis]